MAVFEIQASYNGSFPTAANPIYDSITGTTVTAGALATLHAGAPVARSTVSTNFNNIVPADRSIHGKGAYLGILADDLSRSGNTKIGIDPVGSTYIDASGTFQANNNGFFVSASRKLGDLQAEQINSVTNLTAGASGYQGPARGAGVYVAGAFHILITDQFVQYKTNDTATATTALAAGEPIDGGLLTQTASANAVTFADVAFTSSDTYNPNDLVTFGVSQALGASGNAGQFVKVQPGFNYGLVAGRVDNYNAATGVLQITTF